MCGRGSLGVRSVDAHLAELSCNRSERSYARTVDAVVIGDENPHRVLRPFRLIRRVMPEITVVHNPTAGNATLSRDELSSMLADAGYQVRYQTTEEKWKMGRQDAGSFVVAAGGDGTVRKVAVRLAGGDVPFAGVPLGTANNFAVTLGIHGTPPEVVATWATYRP